MRVLIVSSGEPRGAFAATRYLSRAGWSVAVGTADPRGLLSWSRATNAAYEVPPVELDVDAFITATAEAVEASRSELVLPGSDAELLALSRERARIPAIVPYADDAVVRRSVDKLELARASQLVGLPAPATVSATPEAVDRARYPVVVKARFHWLPEQPADVPSRLPAAICPDRASASAHAEGMRHYGSEPLLQEFADGNPVNVHLVTDRDGEVLGMLQQDGGPFLYPPGAGLRVRSVVVPLEPVLEAGIPALMRELGWFGFAGLNFVRGTDGIPLLTDFNGRLPGGLEASASAGPNYVAVWAALATGRPPPDIPRPLLGKRFHNLEADLRRARLERRGGLLRDLAGTLAYAPRAQHTIVKWDDPLVVFRWCLHVLWESHYALPLRRRRDRSR